MKFPYRTLGELPTGAFLVVKCGACGHRSELAGQGLASMAGPRFPILGLLDRLTCRVCSHRSAAVDVVLPLRQRLKEPNWRARMRPPK